MIVTVGRKRKDSPEAELAKVLTAAANKAFKRLRAELDTATAATQAVRAREEELRDSVEHLRLDAEHTASILEASTSARNHAFAETEYLRDLLAATEHRLKLTQEEVASTTQRLNIETQRCVELQLAAAAGAAAGSGCAQPATTKEETSLCVCCVDAVRDRVFHPCMHLAACGTCAAKLDKCPVCRQGVEGSLLIYHA